MIESIKRFLKPDTGTYVSAKYSILTTSLIERWMELKKIPNQVKPDKMHTTILHSTKTVDKKFHISISKIQLEVRAWRFIPTKLDIFGKNDERILVLRLHAPELEFLHNQLILNGGTHDFSTYDPHITLSNEVPKSFNHNLIALPPIYLVPIEIKTGRLKQ